MDATRYEIVRSSDGQFHARFVRGGNIIWWTENYVRKEDAQNAINSIATHGATALVYDLT